MLKVESLEELLELFRTYNEPWLVNNNYGKDIAEKLFKEIRNKESMLQVNPLRRVVQVVRMYIYQKDYILLEDLRETKRLSICRPASEKIFIGETVPQAANRGINEELGDLSKQISLLETDIIPQEEERGSKNFSYFPTKYLLYNAYFYSNSLPENTFTTSEKLATGGVIHHTWRWKRTFEQNT